MDNMDSDKYTAVAKVAAKVIATGFIWGFGSYYGHKVSTSYNKQLLEIAERSKASSMSGSCDNIPAVTMTAATAIVWWSE